MPSRRYRRRKPEEKFIVPVNQRKGPPPGPEILPWYWHPERDGAQPPPKAFDKRLKEIDPDLYVCYSPVHERWLVWVRNPARRNGLCRGWQLIFLWEHPDTNAYLELNELVFHNLFLVMRDRFPNAEAYYDRIAADIQRRREERNKQFDSERKAEQGEFYKTLHTPSTAGRGNKFALYGDGTLVPSPGAAAWRAETRKARLPGAYLQQERDEKEKQFYGRD